MPAVGEPVRCTDGLMDDAAAAELPARSPDRPHRDARRAALLVPWRTHLLDLLGVRCGGVWAAATCRLPRPRRTGRAVQRSDETAEIGPQFPLGFVATGRVTCAIA
jgi:hypothetical protein